MAGSRGAREPSIDDRETPRAGATAARPRPNGTKLLAGTGAERIWRIAVGNYRLYQVLDDRLVVLVIRVANRREAYGRALRCLLKELP